jgi:hypothetical protein
MIEKRAEPAAQEVGGLAPYFFVLFFFLKFLC